jgi:hypothetical protein
MITQKRLKEVLHYDPETGIFTWIKPSANRLSVGDVAGGVITFPHNNKSYHHIRVDKVLYKSHRLAWVYVHGDIDDSLQIDHINNDGTDNRLVNLRLVTGAENVKNKRKYKNNKSGHTGVYSRYGKWVAQISCGRKKMQIGIYESIDEAIKARLEKQKELGFMEDHGK